MAPKRGKALRRVGEAGTMRRAKATPQLPASSGCCQELGVSHASESSGCWQHVL